MKSSQVDWKSKSRKRQQDSGSNLKVIQNAWQAKHRKTESAADRLKEFREATMLGPIFICISCHMKLFKTNVRECTQDLLDTIDAKIPLSDCIHDLNVFTYIELEYSHLRVPASYKLSTDYAKKRYICNTCCTYLKKGKLPPVSVMNGLSLQQTDEQLKKENLILTELEASLVAPSILFEKIY